MSDKIVRCSNCREEIYEYINPYKNDACVSSDFMGINGNRNPIEGEETSCPRCNYNIFNDLAKIAGVNR